MGQLAVLCVAAQKHILRHADSCWGPGVNLRPLPRLCQAPALRCASRDRALITLLYLKPCDVTRSLHTKSKFPCSIQGPLRFRPNISFSYDLSSTTNITLDCGSDPRTPLGPPAAWLPALLLLLSSRARSPLHSPSS